MGDEMDMDASRELSPASGVKLLPCPFCGAPAATSTFVTESLFSHNQVEFLNVGCPDDCDIFMSGEQQDEVRAAWNRRAPVADASDRREANRSPAPLGPADAKVLK